MMQLKIQHMLLRFLRVRNYEGNVEVIRAFSSHYAKCILDDIVANKHQRQHEILSKTVENNTPCYSNIYKIDVIVA